MKFDQGTITSFYEQVCASRKIQKTCNDLLKNNSLKENPMRSVLVKGLISILTTYSSLQSKQLTGTDKKEFVASSKLYRSELIAEIKKIKPTLIELLNFGEVEKEKFDKIVLMNYAPLDCVENATEAEKQAHNFMLETNACVAFLKKYAPGILNKMTGKNDPWSVQENLLFLDLCAFVFDNPGFKKKNYYDILDNFCEDLEIGRSEFFLINILNVWFSVIRAKLDRKDPIKILIAGSYAKTEAFAFGETSVLETDLLKAYCCGHPTVYWMYVVKTYKPERIAQENAAFCGFFLEDNNEVPFVEDYGDKEKFEKKFPKEKIEEMKRIRLANLAKGRENLAKANAIRWGKRYEELVIFQKENGHTRVPTESVPLGRWVSRQRITHANNDTDKIGKLDLIGFEWDVQTANIVRTWNERYEELVIFQKENGHTRVPTESGPLGRWVSRQRITHANNDTDKIGKLDLIGFEWDVQTANIARTWNERYEELVIFQKENGHTRVPTDSGPLGSWVQYQRSTYANNDTDKIRQLELIGFEWQVNKKRKISQPNISTGRWTDEEHKLFSEGLEKYGSDWIKVAETITSRNNYQVYTHAQKYFNKLPKEQQQRARNKLTGTGRWTDEEHKLFLKGLEKYGRKWTKVAEMITTRTTNQIKSHAQKHFKKLAKEKEG